MHTCKNLLLHTQYLVTHVQEITFLSHVTGGTNASLSRQFHVGRSTVGKAIKETCDAIHEVLAPDYLTVSIGKDTNIR